MHNRKRAFTLPETSITIAILAFAILYFILAFTVSKYAAILSKQRIVALNLLRAEMENILDSDYDNIQAVSESITVDDGLKSMNLTKTIELTTEDSAIYGYKKVYFKMGWIGGMSGTKPLDEEAIMYVTRR